jgi:hypothetical protein
MRNEALEATGSDGLTLRVEFVWRGDRFGHVISAIEEDGDQVPLVESVEGTKAEDWPSSPPLQSLRIETLAGGRRAALLVGMAGRSHWSASVEPVVGEAALVFDIACRHPPGAQGLGSRYRRLSEAAERLMLQADGARLVKDDTTIAIEALLDRTPTARWRYALHLR